MSRAKFPKEVREAAAAALRFGTLPRDAVKHVNERFGSKYTERQFVCLRSNLGLGPRQARSGSASPSMAKRRSRRLESYTVLISGPSIEATMKVTREQAVAVFQALNK